MPPGVVIPFWLDRPPAEAVEVALAAEELGYGEVWMGEMLHFDAFALAGAIAARTTRITITVGPLALGLRDSVALAMGTASISVLGGRPARLALGASSPAVVEAWHGRNWGGEASRLCDAVAIIRTVMAGGRTDHQSGFSSRGFRSPLAPQPCHVSVAAAGEKMLAAAALCADRVVLNLVAADDVTSARMTGQEVAVWLVTGVDPDQEGLEQVRRQLALYLNAPGYAKTLARAGMTDLVAAANRGAKVADLASMFTSAQVEQVAALGSVNEVKKRIKEYCQAGAEVMVVPVTAGDSAGRRTLAALAN